MDAAPNDIFTKTIGALLIDTVKTYVKTMEILDRIYRRAELNSYSPVGENPT